MSHRHQSRRRRTATTIVAVMLTAPLGGLVACTDTSDPFGARGSGDDDRTTNSTPYSLVGPVTAVSEAQMLGVKSSMGKIRDSMWENDIIVRTPADMSALVAEWWPGDLWGGTPLPWSNVDGVVVGIETVLTPSKVAGFGLDDEGRIGFDMVPYEFERSCGMDILAVVYRYLFVAIDDPAITLDTEFGDVSSTWTVIDRC